MLDRQKGCRHSAMHFPERTGLGVKPLVGDLLEDEPEFANNVANSMLYNNTV
jgi:hypothetical protein